MYIFMLLIFFIKFLKNMFFYVSYFEHYVFYIYATVCRCVYV